MRLAGPSTLAYTAYHLHKATCLRTCTRRPLSTSLRRNSHTETPAEELGEYDFGTYDVILPAQPFVWGVSHIKPRAVLPHIPRPPYARGRGDGREIHNQPVLGHRRIKLGDQDEAKLRGSARLAKDVLNYAGSLVKIGVTTEYIDAQVHDMIVAHGAYPSPLLYQGYPKSCCTSVNNVVTHGIPDDRPLQEGDIVNIDITVYKDGFHGDTSRTFLVGDVDQKGQELVQVTDDALEAGITACGPGRPFNGIGRAIFEIIKHRDFSVSTQFTGHGIGEDFHRPPWILHHPNEEPGLMSPGHCFTIEPCIVQGSQPNAWIFPDGWTASTENCARSAQAEHMVLITDTGAEVLTR
ncbi:methionyl aminopeptidase [Wolfiporia cocos MD-104 SS10]|uniref:Methionine aminopeptidase n=1 Tax=Wolfiporia cocos (strain MD-104) TaxID=742152 RepID=A0A2H3JFR2_WOLCO|nr:methionyl aminopeptidase [Wolfiporia cocos MD-104 SS10]